MYSKCIILIVPYSDVSQYTSYMGINQRHGNRMGLLVTGLLLLFNWLPLSRSSVLTGYAEV